MAEKFVPRHIKRPPLPWRTESLTECGHPTEEFAEVLTRDEAIRQHREMGAQRFAMVTCMTCIGTANRWPTFEEDPVDRLRREFYLGRRPKGDLMRRELLAVAALIAAHPEEFAETVDGLADVEDLSAVRRARRRRGA
jgi:hypothetical protein